MKGDQKLALEGGDDLVAKAVALDQSAASCRDQLREGYCILELDSAQFQASNLDDIARDPEDVEYSPRAEWVLRWLTKRFNADDIHANSFSLYPESWQLLRLVLRCTPNKIAAKILQGSNFVSTLSQTLAWAAQHSVIHHVVDDEPEVKPNKRRKKSSGDAFAVAPAIRSVDPLLLPSICVFVQELRLKVDTGFTYENGRSGAERLKRAIRTDPNEAAKILSNSLTAALKNAFVVTNIHLLYKLAIDPMCWVWKSAEGVAGESSDEVDKAFSSTCMVPAITLLSKFPVKDSCDLKFELEELVVLHSLIPARAVFFTHKSPDDRKVKKMRKLLHPYFSPLIDMTTPDQETSDGALFFGSTFLHPFACCFELVERAFPRDTHAQREKEDPWLNRVLDYIRSCHPWRSSEVNGGTREVTRQLLEICGGRNISVEEKAVKKICQSIARLSPDAEDIIDWRMVGQCFRLCPSIVVPASRDHDEYKKITKAFLGAMYATVFGHSQGLRSQNSKMYRREIEDERSQRYEDAIRCAVLPLLGICAERRLLPIFIDFWRDGLYASVDFGEATYSIWEDERISFAISFLVEDSLADSQILEELKTCRELISADLHDHLNYGVSAHSGSLVACGLIRDLSRTSCIDLLRSEAGELYESIPTIMDNPRAPPDVRSSLWLLGSLIITPWAEFLLQESRESVLRSLTSSASEAIQNSSLKEKDTVSIHQEAYLAYGFVQSGVEAYVAGLDAAPPGLLGAWFKILEKFSCGVDTEKDEPKSKDENTPAASTVWCGASDDIMDYERLRLACSIAAALHPKHLLCIRGSILKGFLQHLRRGASVELASNHKPRATTHDAVTYHSSWMSLCKSSEFKSSRAASRSLRQIVVDRFQEIWRCTKAGFFLSSLKDNGLEEILCLELEQEQRTLVEGAMMGQIQTMRTPPAGSLLAVLTVLSRVLDKPDQEMKVVKHPATRLWTILLHLYKTTATEMQPVIPLLREVLHKVMPSSCFVEGARAKFEDLGEQSFTSINRRLDDASFPEPFVVLTWGCLILEILTERAPLLLAKHKSTEQRIVRLIAEWFTGGIAYSGSSNLAHVHEILIENLVVLRHSQVKRDPANSNYEKMLRFATSESAEWSLRREQAARVDSSSGSFNLFNLELLNHLHVQNRDAASLLAVVQAIKNRDLTDTEDRLDRFVLPLYLELSPTLRGRFLMSLADDADWASSEVVVFILRRALAMTYERDHLTEEFQRVCEWLLLEFRKLAESTTSPAICQLCMSTIDTALRKKSWNITQANIDSTFSLIGVLTSSAHSNLPAEDSSDIYTGLCTMFGSVLTHHRIRIGGRHAIVLPAYQGLLRVLYRPYTSGNSRSLIPQPSWVSSIKPLTAADATRWSRIVTAVCDPKASAVKHGSKSKERSDVNDARKAAKASAGQFFQYIIPSYCDLQLKGVVEPDVKQALEPGLFSVLEAMGSRTRETCNHNLGGEQRVVFRSLCRDWDDEKGSRD